MMPESWELLKILSFLQSVFWVPGKKNYVSMIKDLNVVLQFDFIDQ